jgi:hypothetical protein
MKSQRLNVYIFEWLKLRHYILWRRGHLQWHELPTEFHKKTYQLVQKLVGGQTHEQDNNLISLHFSFRIEIVLKFK